MMESDLNMRRSFRKSAVLVVASVCLVLSGASFSEASFVYPGSCPVSPGGVAVWPFPQGGAVIAAYQQPYAMNFEVWKPMGLPAGWYATFDGFPVAQAAQNRWVYGQLGPDGALVPTCVLVGSVVPGQVPGLTRIAATGLCGRYVNDPEFCKIMDYRCDRMGIIRDPLARTVVAWRSGSEGAWVWLGDRWKKIKPLAGEYTWHALKRRRQWIGEELRKNCIWWFCVEPCDFANLARQWGLLWGGEICLDALGGYRGGDGAENRDFRNLPAGRTPDTPEKKPDNGGQWDVE